MSGLVWLAVAAVDLKPKAKALHGDAKFASGGALASKGFFKDADGGVVVGRHGGKLMKLDGQQFAILAAPTRSGKGVGVVIPSLLEYRESMVVLDIKQENFELKTLATRPFLSEPGRQAFANLVSQADETFASIMGTLKEPLNAWINPVLDAATSEDDFLHTDVRRKKMTIYIGIQPSKLAEARLIVNLFFSQLINQKTRELPTANPALKCHCLLPIIQSMAQLDAVYGKALSRTIITNHALQIVYTPLEQQDANDVMCGKIAYYKERHFTSRLMRKAEVPALKV